MFYRNKSCASDNHHSGFGEIHRHNRNLFLMDVVPDVELGPVGKREDADALALISPTVVDIPKLRALILRVPLSKRIAKRVDSFLGARLLLVRAAATERR